MGEVVVRTTGFRRRDEILPQPASVDLTPIESAISLSILDIISEREWKRTQSSPKQESQSNEPG